MSDASNDAGAPPILSYAAKSPDNRDASRSFVFGLLLFVPFVSGVLAIRFGRSGVRAAQHLSGRGLNLARSGIFLGWINLILSTLFAVLVVPALIHAHHKTLQNRCMANLRQIGQGLYAYSLANGGHLPPTLNHLMAAKIVPAKVFVCPEDSLASSKPMTPGTSGPCSYVHTYPGERLTKLYPDTILAYEPPSNHNGRGMAVLYADGSVRWLDAQRDQQVIADILAGKNHIRRPTTATMLPQRGSKACARCCDAGDS